MDYRVLRRQARQRDEELQSNREGVTYEAHRFDDLGMRNAPPRKRKRPLKSLKLLPDLIY